MSRVITKGTILSLASNTDVYNRGEAYYRSGKILSVTTERNSSQELISFTIEGNHRNYNVVLTYNQSGDLQHYKCDCDSDSIWRGACKHVVAGMFSLMEGNSSLLEISKMDRTSRALTAALEKQIYTEIDESLASSEFELESELDKVQLVPFLHISGWDDAYLDFKVGAERLYVLKNIDEFLVHLQNQDTASYSAKLKFRHTRSAFTTDSQGLLDFIIRENSVYHEGRENLTRNYSSLRYVKNDSRNLFLNMRNIDDFIDLVINKAIPTDEGRIQITEDRPPIGFRVECRSDRVILHGKKQPLILLHGHKFTYFYIGDTLYRVPLNVSAAIESLLAAMRPLHEAFLVFKETDRTKFLTVLLPYLNRLGLISSIEGNVDDAPMIEMTPKLFFDSDGKSVSCCVIFNYEKIDINPLLPQQDYIGRDMPGEYRIQRYLLVYGFEPVRKTGFFTLTGDDASYRFIRSGLEELKQCAEVYVTDALKQKAAKVSIPSIGVRIAGNLLQLNMESSEFSFVELLEAMENIRAKKKYHRLKDGRFLDLEDENLQALTKLTDSLDLSKKDVLNETISMPKYRALYLDQLIQEKQNISIDDGYQKIIDDFQHARDLDFPPPPELENILRDYQKIGFHWLKILAHYGFGGILADDMGLGKTLQVIALFLSEAGPDKKFLVVAPTSLLFNWENEIHKFAPSLTTQLVSGFADKRKDLLLEPADVYITTYDMFKRDIDYYETMQFDIVVADEAQNIKNPLTQNAKSLKALQTKSRFALTGTPIENSLTELWSIFDFILPGYLHNAHKFARLYETPIVKLNDKERAAMLRKQIAPFLLRRVKNDVLKELPEKTEMNLYAELLPEQKKLYMAHLLKARGELEESGAAPVSRIKILAQLTQLRQLCCHPSLFMEGYNSGSGKLDLALETIQMVIESGHRALLFSQFTSMLDILKKELDMLYYSYFYLDGATPAKERLAMADKFNAGERELFLISLKAGGTGLNLIGADVVIHYDPWWNPSVMDQASDRAHRFGQTQMVQVFNLVSKDTIEEKILDLHDKKKDLVDAVIDEEESGMFINRMTEEELKSLFQE